MRKGGRPLQAVITTLFLALFATSARAEVLYHLVDLGTFGGDTVWPWRMNDVGQVAGDASHPPFADSHPFRTGPQAPMNALTDDLDPARVWITVYGLNNSGQAVGYGLNPTSPGDYVSFRTAPNASINFPADNLGSLGGNSTVASDVNDAGVAVGYSTRPDGTRRAFRTAPNAPINAATDDLGTLGGRMAEATAINDLGQVVGWAETADGHMVAFRTAPNAPINPLTDSLETFAIPRAINNKGQVVGILHDGQGHLFGGFRSEPNGPIRQFLEMFTHDINDDGLVVGSGVEMPGGDSVAMLFDGTTSLNLNNLIPADPRWTLTSANSINNLGQIVGVGLFEGQQRAFRLDPIPEPSTLSLCALGLTCLARRRSRVREQSHFS